MENLWAPWRIEYILSKKPEGCIFCNKPGENKDEENLISPPGPVSFHHHECFSLQQWSHDGGSFRHTATLSAWAGDEQQEMMQLADLAVELLRKTMHPDGFNLGINMGIVGGAGMADHIHLHIVPRWNGDTNFMPVLSDTRVISEHLRATFGTLKKALAEMENG